MMKVLLVISTLKQGGAERVISVLANQWVAKGYEVHIALLIGGDNFYDIHESVVIHEFGFQYKNNFEKCYKETKLLFKLRRLIKSLKPGFVLSFITQYNIISILAAAGLKSNVFVSERRNPKTPLPKVLFLVRNVTYYFAKGIIAQTNLAQYILKKETKNLNIKVIANPISEMDHDKGLLKENIVLNVGRFIPEKGQKYLIDAFSKIENNTWKLVILGDGPLRSEYEKQIINLGVQSRVFFPGNVKNVNEWYLKSKIFAFSSLSEGFPNALAEAMCAGLACVSFDCDTGPRDIILDGQNGVLVPVSDVEALANKINILIKDEQLMNDYMNEAKKLKEKLNAEMISESYFSFCNSSHDIK